MSPKDWLRWSTITLCLCCPASGNTVDSPAALEEYIRHGTMVRSTTQPGYSAATAAMAYVRSAPTDVLPVLSRLAVDQDLGLERRMMAVMFLTLTRSPGTEPVLLGLLEDRHPLIQTVAMSALAAAQCKSPVLFEKLKKCALDPGGVELQIGAVMALLELKDRPEAMAVVEQAYRSPDVNDIAKLQIARTRAHRKHDFDKSVAKDILYRKLADPWTSLSEQCNVVSDLALLGDSSQTYRLANALENERSRDLAIRVLGRLFPDGPKSESGKTQVGDNSVVSQWKDYLRADRRVLATTRSGE